MGHNGAAGNALDQGFQRALGRTGRGKDVTETLQLSDLNVSFDTVLKCGHQIHSRPRPASSPRGKLPQVTKMTRLG